LKGHFAALEADDNRGINESRGYACEYVAWRFVTQLSSRETIDILLYELPPNSLSTPLRSDEEVGVRRGSHGNETQDDSGETTPLLSRSIEQLDEAERILATPTVERFATMGRANRDQEAFASLFDNLNALEVAAVTKSKKFLSQRVLQRMIESIWRGDIVFWETLSVDTRKEPKVYSQNRADPFSRLRVPQYLKAFEAIFFLSFLALYYAVLVPVQRHSQKKSPEQVFSDSPVSLSDSHNRFHSINSTEVLLYIWIVSFAYDECLSFHPSQMSNLLTSFTVGDYMDAGQAFYAADFWSLWDIGIVAIGMAFFICSKCTRAVLVDEPPSTPPHRYGLST
jgi:hypothetical protein